jgi:hypothetical protein
MGEYLKYQDVNFLDEFTFLTNIMQYNFDSNLSEFLILYMAVSSFVILYILDRFDSLCGRMVIII